MRAQKGTASCVTFSIKAISVLWNSALTHMSLTTRHLKSSARSGVINEVLTGPKLMQTLLPIRKLADPFPGTGNTCAATQGCELGVGVVGSGGETMC